MEHVARIGMDTSKHLFQLHGVDAEENVVLRRQVRRSQLMNFFQRLPSTVIGIEACGASHHWARMLKSLGHEVRLLPPQYVKPYVKRNKNDSADAAAVCEAMSRPTMRFVPVKTRDNQAVLMLLGMRERLLRARTQLSNAIRGYAAEFGLTVGRGISRLEHLFERIAADSSLPALAHELFNLHAQEYRDLQMRIAEVEDKLDDWRHENEKVRRLTKVPGIGPIGAALLVMKAPDPEYFRSGRDFAAWIGLTPRDHSSGGKRRHGGISHAGDEALRSVLVAGATNVIRYARLGRGQPSPWLTALVKRKPPMLAAVAWANKMARIAWKLLVSGEAYAGSSAPPRLSAQAG
ncbi:IS110 family transposase [Ensifer sp. SSB1]|jgi:transposase|uniref:IS110 family transposase n=1 Tax=Ensifer sp. SSB1 TaxID=2795385 RepID=UPI001A4E5F09|nr:IS110 family transposase [Ensifer sp. SSB1]MBK5571025.1 IS110 family transposase [Ensifer sp. SSB1]